MQVLRGLLAGDDATGVARGRPNNQRSPRRHQTPQTRPQDACTPA